ncbi:MAG: hypothetical protein WC489_08640 [Patescibacteria group bacterium]
MRHLTWKNVFLTLLGASLVSIAGFYATGMGGFAAVASAIVIVLNLTIEEEERYDMAISLGGHNAAE